MKNIIYLLFLLLSFTAFSQEKSIQIEPMNWWVGMKNPNLQLVLRGEIIKGAQVKSAKAGLKILKIHNAESPNYLFVDVYIDKAAKSGEYPLQIMKDGKSLAIINYSLEARVSGSQNRESFTSKDVIYLITPDRFANGDKNNDAFPAMLENDVDRSKLFARHGGDIQGIIDRLDYIKKMGYTAIWSMPLLENDQKVQSYHGYSITNHYKMDPRFGTNEKFKELCTEANKRGIKIISDNVLNHIGSGHYWMKDMPFKDWINHGTEFVSTNHRRETHQDPHRSLADKKGLVDGWFVPSMPDINQNNPYLATYIIQNTIWWIEYADLDGFRVDTYSYNDKEGISKWTKAITDEYPHFNIVGEVWMHDQAQMSYWQKDSKIGAIQSYNSNLPSVMDFTLHDAIGNVFNEDRQSWDRGMIQVYDNFANDFLYPNPNNLLVFAENHDTGRLNEIYKSDFKKYQLAMTLIATVRGIPQLYYGSEIGMKGDKGKGDADIRRDFPGGWNGDANNAFTKEGRTAEQQKYFEFSSKLFTWRKSKEVIHSGKTTHYVPDNNVYVYFRYNEKETVMVIINNNSEKQTLKTNRFKESIQNLKSGKEVLSGKTFDLNNDIEIEGKSALILELK